MVASMMASGRIIKCTDREILLGLIKDNIQAHMRMIKNVVMENFFGRMVGVIKVFCV